MKTLIERIKPEYLDKIKSNIDEYPAMVERALSVLSSEHFVHLLTLHDAAIICDLLQIDIRNIYLLFNYYDL